MEKVSFLYKVERSSYGSQNMFFSFTRVSKRILSFQAINIVPLIIEVLKNTKIKKEELFSFTVPINNLGTPMFLEHDYYRVPNNKSTKLVRFASPIYLSIPHEEQRHFLIENFEKIISNDSDFGSFYYYSVMPYDVYDTYLENLRKGMFLL